MKKIIKKIVFVTLLLLLPMFVIQVSFAHGYSNKQKSMDNYLWNNLNSGIWVNISKKVNDNYFLQYPKDKETVLVFVDDPHFPFRIAQFYDSYGFLFLDDGPDQEVIEWMKINRPPERFNNWIDSY